MKIKFKIKKLLWLLIVIVGVATATTTVMAFRYSQTQTSNSLKQRTGSLAIAIDHQSIDPLKGSVDDLTNPAYKDLKDKLIAIRKENADARFVYIMGRHNGQVFFYVDSEPANSENYSPPGQSYDEASTLLYNIFDNKNIEYEIGSDRWGKWLSYLAPITNPDTGEVVGVLGIDIPYTNYLSSIVLFSALPFTIGIIIIILLILALVYAKKEEQILQIRSEYFAIAAHDLRTPLTGIKWAMSTLSKLNNDDLAKKSKPIFKQIDSSTENMITSVNELLDSTNLEKSGINSLQMTKVEINSVLKTALDSLQISIDDNQLQLHYTPSKPLTLLADKDKIRRVFSNILSNAIKYSPKGGVIAVTTKVIPNYFIVSIKDHGIGIPQKEQDKIFSGYYRATNAKEYTTQGTGLGLYYASNVVALHGGKITLHSEPHQGTDFIISLPIRK